MKKTKSKPLNPSQKYNKLFKFLTFDLSLNACLIIALIILGYMLIISGLFGLLEIKPEASVY